ncbi:TRAP transporter large permease [Citricoccus parietis]
MALWAVVIAAVVLLFAVPTPEIKGALTIALSVVLILLGLHVGLALLLAGLGGIVALAGLNAGMVSLAETPFNTSASWSLTVIPLFVLMGTALSRFGLMDRLFKVAQAWLAWLPGGLGVATNFAGAGLAATSGSSIGISYTLARAAVPGMLRANYRPAMAVGVVAVAGTLGQLIPPSVMMVVYAGVAETPVGPQLLAGLMPGLITALAFAAVIVVMSIVKPPAPAEGGVPTWSMRERLAVLPGILPVLIISIVVIGGIFAGLFTPTEAGAVGALVAILLGWVALPDKRPTRFLKTLMTCLLEAAGATAAIFLLLIGVHFLTRVVVLSGLAESLTTFATESGLSSVTFLLLLAVVFIVVGMFMDGMAMILISVPVLMPILTTLDIDLLWFGVFLVILVEVALVTPPVGILSFVVHKVVQDPEVNLGHTITIVDVFKGAVPFIAVMLVLLVTLIFVPDIATWLPSVSGAE